MVLVVESEGRGACRRVGVRDRLGRQSGGWDRPAILPRELLLQIRCGENRYGGRIVREVVWCQRKRRMERRSEDAKGRKGADKDEKQAAERQGEVKAVSEEKRLRR